MALPCGSRAAIAGAAIQARTSTYRSSLLRNMRCSNTVGRTGHVSAVQPFALDTLTAWIRESIAEQGDPELRTLILTSEYLEWYSLLHPLSRVVMQYGQFEEALIQMFSIREDSLGAFRARLRHLRRLGIPNIPKRGSGNIANYGAEDLFTTFVALALQTLGSAPAVSVPIAYAAARYFATLGLVKDDIFLIVMNLPELTPENIGDFTPPPGVGTMCWLKNPLGGDTFACVMLGAEKAGKFVTGTKTVASSVINLSEHFRALPNEK
jgi:hypothetical protein